MTDSLKNGGHGHLEVQGLEEEEELTRGLLYRGRWGWRNLDRKVLQTTRENVYPEGGQPSKRGLRKDHLIGQSGGR